MARSVYDGAMRLTVLIALLVLPACTSELADSESPAPAETGGLAADTPTDPVAADVPAVEDAAAPDELPGVAEVGPTADTGPGPADPGSPPGEDGGNAGTCVCETAKEIVWLKNSSHSSCKKPSAGQIPTICKDAKTKEFETGDVFGVKGCKFQVTC